MQEINVWKLENFDKNYTVLTDINMVVKKIIEGELKIDEDSIRTSFIPGEKICDSLQKKYSEQNTIINYTDALHPVLLSEYYISIISPEFYKEHEKEIKDALVTYIKNYDSEIIPVNVPKFVFTDELFDYLIENKENIRFDFELEEKYIHKLENRFINVAMLKNGKKVVISDDILFGEIRFKEAQTSNFFMVNADNLAKSDVNNFRYLKPDSLININIEEAYEEEQLKALYEFFVKLDGIEEKNIFFVIPLARRSNFNKYFKDVKFKNVDLIIANDNHNYPLSEYWEEEKKLDDLVKPVKEANLSPFEKYLACYNIAKQYKKYKEHPLAKEGNVMSMQSRNLRYILDNEYMVCVGFSVLLRELLDRVGIKAEKLSVDVDTSYDKGYTQEEKALELTGHARVIVEMEDDKYNIHGLYIGDPTWDNSLQNNLLNNALMTFDKMQVSRRLFQFSTANPILDIHNFQEFNEQVNFLLKRKINDETKSKIESYQDSDYNGKCDAYKLVLKNLIKEITNENDRQKFLTKSNISFSSNSMLKILDEVEEYLLKENNQNITESIKNNIHNHDDFTKIKDNIYTKCLKQATNNYLKENYPKIITQSYKDVCNKIIDGLKVDSKYQIYYEKLEKCEKEQDYINFLTDLGNYLLTRVNKRVPDETIIKASMESDRIIKGLNEEEYEQKLKETTELFNRLDVVNFPYKNDNSINQSK